MTSNVYDFSEILTIFLYDSLTLQKINSSFLHFFFEQVPLNHFGYACADLMIRHPILNSIYLYIVHTYLSLSSCKHTHSLSVKHSPYICIHVCLSVSSIILSFALSIISRKHTRATSSSLSVSLSLSLSLPSLSHTLCLFLPPPFSLTLSLSLSLSPLSHTHSVSFSLPLSLSLTLSLSLSLSHLFF